MRLPISNLRRWTSAIEAIGHEASRRIAPPLILAQLV